MRCTNPFTAKDTGYQFPCGKCLSCKKNRVSGWSFRLRKQAQAATSAFFLTLTYDTDYVPLIKNSNRPMTLNKKDVQYFMKRLRKVNYDKLKYYACGEYGDEKMRPHYHIIMFNMELSSLISKQEAAAAMQNISTMLNGKWQFKSPIWPQGIITIGQVEAASIGYCLEYITKPQIIPQWATDKRQKEFSLMSKGLGLNYLTPEIISWHKSDINHRFYVPIEDGKKIAMPRLFKQKIYTQIEREAIAQVLMDEEYKTYQQLTEKEKIIKYEKHMMFVVENERKVRSYKTKKTIL